MNNTPAAFVLDIGAAVTLISQKLWKQGTLPGHEPQPWDGPNLVGANGSPITVHGTDNVVLNIAGIDLPLQVIIADGLTAEAILGLALWRLRSPPLTLERNFLH